MKNPSPAVRQGLKESEVADANIRGVRGDTHGDLGGGRLKNIEVRQYEKLGQNSRRNMRGVRKRRRIRNWKRKW